MDELRLGPDSARYLWAGGGKPVPRPFNLRWLLPAVCRQDPKRWWLAWGLSWPLLAVAAVGYARASGATWWASVATGGLLVALPGVWGPAVVRPVGVDLPALALGLASAWCFLVGLPWLAWPLLLMAAATKETAPVFVALWVPSLWPLLALAVPALLAVVRKSEMDPWTSQGVLRRVHDHPIRSALEHHQGQWRDAWIMVAPWGACLAALYSPSWQVFAVLAVAYAQLLVATDSVRLYQTAAGPVMALAAAQVIPEPWLVVALVLHVWWWRKPELV